MFVNERPCDWTPGLFLAWLQSRGGAVVGTVSMILLDINKKKSGLSEDQMDTNQVPAQNRQPVRLRLIWVCFVFLCPLFWLA